MSSFTIYLNSRYFALSNRYFSHTIPQQTPQRYQDLNFVRQTRDSSSKDLAGTLESKVILAKYSTKQLKTIGIKHSDMFC